MATRRENKSGSVRKLPDGRFECIVQSRYLNDKGNPKRFKRVAPTEDEAVKKAQMALKAWEKGWINSGADIKVKKSRTFGSYMEEYIDTVARKTLTDSGYYNYTKTMRANFYGYHIAQLQLHMLSKKEFGDYYNEMLKTKAEKTCSIPRQLCIRCCKWLIDKSYLDENYAEQGQEDINRTIIDEYNAEMDELERSRKKIFSNEDIQKFYYAYKNNMGEYPVIVLFLLETGMRAQEFATLKLKNVDLEENKIWIRETTAYRFKKGEDGKSNKDNGTERYTKHPKNKEARFIIMSELCKECVLYMKEQTKLKCPNNPEGFLYPTFRNGKARQNSSMEVCFKELCNKLEIDRDVRLTKAGGKKGLCLHSLRHTYDSIANSQKGANIVNTALAMGHRAISTENVYTHATEEGLKSIVTPSQAVLEGYKKEESKTKAKTDEALEIISKLKEDKELLNALKDLLKE